MRKSLLLLAIVLAILTGCANSEDVLENTFLGEEVLTDEQLQSTVPIRFAPVSITATVEEMPLTRTSASGNTITGLGMFCLGKRPINDGITDGRSPSWSGKSKNQYVNTLGVWKNNEPVSLVVGGDNKGDIVWGDPTIGASYMPNYPNKDWFAYGFVAYYPRTENLVYTQTSITAYIKLDGSKPVFYAMAKEPLAGLDDDTKNLSFSKSYYEALDAESGTEKFINPYFEFEYLTTALNFVFYSKGEPVNNLHIDKVEFDKFPCIMMLGLAKMLRYANKTAYDMKSFIASNPFVWSDSVYQARELSQFEDFADGYEGHYELYEENGESISGRTNSDGSYKYTISTEKKKVGGAIYIPPTKRELKLFITVADDNGNKYKCENPVLVSTKSGWKKGTSYDIPIWLNNPSEVARDASLAQWEPGEPIVVNATNTTWEELP